MTAVNGLQMRSENCLCFYVYLRVCILRAGGVVYACLCVSVCVLSSH